MNPRREAMLWIASRLADCEATLSPYHAAQLAPVASSAASRANSSAGPERRRTAPRAM